MRFNVNNNVRVKLTDRGREIRRRDHDQLYAVIAERGGTKRPYRPVEEDADGWSTWQMWSLMQMFGAHMANGRPMPFETEIDIDDEYLT